MTRLSSKSRRPSRGRANLAHLGRVSDAEIARTAPPELADLPDDFWAEPALVLPVAKRAISLRVDEDVLDWFRTSGPRYQSRMNAVLRSYMAYVRRRRGQEGAASR
ncbi:hypothetical protein MELA_02795 [Candidatus Methylomirabilis lanthanidiphila]|uniref:BrnA antitoxin of type II toxin-antitoxin system n=1 Tax=Candidatus Methylomirabilis lanthanidiphila TaxID=2211376 RepID=A0A564ZP09_9BACT|nr:BrnA antitoxin family protein [Candidatus Methylomirabilis lanthanidiphila]VUZ86392.1 hypothetical protein MELA_02795 [Candidatus Methylomirabilis lanthanidiphila]